MNGPKFEQIVHAVESSVIIGMDFSALKFWTLSMLMDVSFNEKKKIA